MKDRLQTIALTRLVTAMIYTISASITLADVPRLIHYQGKLLTSTGAPALGPINLRLRLYDSPTVSTPVLFDEIQETVALNRGHFSILIGTNIPGGVPDSAVESQQVWLGIAVNGNPEFIRRTRLVTTPYTIKSRSAEQLVRPDTLEPAATVNSNGTVDILGSLAVAGNPGSANQILTSRGPGVPPTWNTSDRAFNPAFPDGLDNITPVTRDQLSTMPYIVPAGKTLYITNAWIPSNDLYELRINGVFVRLACHFSQNGGSLNVAQMDLPVLAGAGDSVSANEDRVSINGFLADSGVTSVSRSALDTTPYMVPAGKTLFITNVSVNSNSAYHLRINGVFVAFASNFSDGGLHEITSLGQPILAASGDQISATNNSGSPDASGVAINGYLRNN